jgi:1-acyl-sn-glycerol-3-phosphate acyltransferase
LWLSQVARVTADNCLRVFVLLTLAAAERAAAWHLVVALLMLPAVVLSPFNGALSNSLPKRWVLVGSAAYCFGVTALFAGVNDAWVVCWALVAVGSAVYGPTRYALLPAAAEDTHVPLTRVNGWIEMGAGAALGAGMVLGGHLHFAAYEWFPPVPDAVAVAVLLNLVGVLAAWPVWFASDVRRPEGAARAVAGFFRDARRVLAHREARVALLAMSGFRGLVAALTGALLAPYFQRGALSAENLLALLYTGAWIVAGVALGSLLAGLQGHPRRSLGLVAYGATGLVAGLLFVPAGSALPGGVGMFLGVMAGLINVPLAAAYQASLPADARGNGMAVRTLADYVAMATLSVLLYALAHYGLLDTRGQFWFVTALAAAGALLGWWLFYREGLELVVEALMWPLYRIRSHGPGKDHFPREGPVLVISNHSAWVDPLFLAKVVPRRIIAMMTSQFYDLKPLRWFFKNVVRAIRVQASTYRREAPELKKAIEELDQGECVVIFPEGAMRRRENQPLRQFGQGVWHLLKERPKTPVVVCWIEGNWGCYFSYWNGPPTANKRLDFWRRIRVAINAPFVIDGSLLEDHRATRAFLMQVCLDTRKYLGLEPLPFQKADERGEGEEQPQE